VCHGVIVRRCPDARVIDLTHVVPRHDVRSGAILLRAALPYLPPRVHLAVVDPGVSAAGPSGRRAVALRTVRAGQAARGPGQRAADARRRAAGRRGSKRSTSASRRSACSRCRATFHGRDIFAPVAAALAAGEPLASVGEPLPVDALRRMGIPSAALGDGVLTAHVLRSDTFGNLILNASNEQLVELGATLGDTLTVRHEGARHTASYVATFADVTPGELLIYEDAQRMVSLAVNRGSAAQLLGADQDDELLILPA